MTEQLGFGGSDFEERHEWVPQEVIDTKYGAFLLKMYLVTSRELLMWMRELLLRASAISYDSETSGKNPHLGARICGHGFACFTGQREVTAFYVPIRHIGDWQSDPQLPVDEVSAVVREVLAPGVGEVATHNEKFERWLLRADNILMMRESHDTAVAAQIDNENENSFQLDRLANLYIDPNATDYSKVAENWMRKDARKLGMKLYETKRGEDDESAYVFEQSYMDKYGHSRVPARLEGRYCCKDVFYTLLLRHLKYAHVPKQWPQVYERDMAVAREVLHEMEWHGLPANPKTIEATARLIEREEDSWLKLVRSKTHENFNATDDECRELFYEKLKLKCPKYTKPKGKKGRASKSTGTPSVDKEARQLLIHNPSYVEHKELLEAVHTLATVRKIRSTYAAPFLRHYSTTTGCIHGIYNQIENKHRSDNSGVPVTGRLSSSEPNVQNIAKKPISLIRVSDEEVLAVLTEVLGPSHGWSPVKNKKTGKTEWQISVRRYFTVPEGFIRFYIDFSQIELRILCWYCQDATMLHAYRNNIDLHQLTADRLGIDRDPTAKQVNFGNNYGMTEVGLAKRMKDYYKDPKGTTEEAKRILEAYFREYSAIPGFKRMLAARIVRDGGLFISPFGRPRRIQELLEREQWKRERGARMMMSTAVSGLAADLMKETMLRASRWLRQVCPEARLSQTIHDEIIYDVPLRAGWAEILFGLTQLSKDWPIFSGAGYEGRGSGVPIDGSASITTTTWEAKREIKVLPDGTFQFAA